MSQTNLFSYYKLDRTALSVASLHDPSDEPAFWHAQPPEERMRAMEFMRQISYGTAATTAGLQRVVEVAQHPLR